MRYCNALPVRKALKKKKKKKKKKTLTKTKPVSLRFAAKQLITLTNDTWIQMIHDIVAYEPI